MGTVYLLEAVRQTPTVKAVVNVTSDKCYENKEWVWPYRENEPMGGYDPYSNSKGCSELVTAAYRNSFIQSSGVALASARAGNVIGGGDWASDRLVPDILRSFAQNQPVNIRNPNAIRPWQHVLEPLGGYLTLAERLYKQGQVFAQGWNFGPLADDAKPVQWIVEHMAKLWGEGPRWQKVGSTQPHEANYLKLDISKAQAQLGWRPTLGLLEALQLTVDWARHHTKGGDMKSITQQQIQLYQNLQLN
jgi:CDP-glucose 4,6-dehydratase